MSARTNEQPATPAEPEATAQPDAQSKVKVIRWTGPARVKPTKDDGAQRRQGYVARIVAAVIGTVGLNADGSETFEDAGSAGIPLTQPMLDALVESFTTDANGEPLDSLEAIAQRTADIMSGGTFTFDAHARQRKDRVEPLDLASLALARAKARAESGSQTAPQS